MYLQPSNGIFGNVYLSACRTTLRGKHCWHPIAVMEVVNTFGHCVLKWNNWKVLRKPHTKVQLGRNIGLQSLTSYSITHSTNNSALGNIFQKRLQNFKICTHCIGEKKEKNVACTCFAYSKLLEIRQSTIEYVGYLVCLDKWFVNQASEVPSIIFFIISYRLNSFKTLYFNCCKFIKKKEIRNKLKQVLKTILQEIMKKK